MGLDGNHNSDSTQRAIRRGSSGNYGLSMAGMVAMSEAELNESLALAKKVAEERWRRWALAEEYKMARLIRGE